MATIELRLNSRKPGNYAFFCPVTKLHLTLTNPVGTADRVSAYILRGVKAKTLIDVNNVINLETGELNVKGKAKDVVKEEPVKEVKAEEVVKPETATPDQSVELSQEAEVAVEEKKTGKRGKKAQNNVDAE